MKQNYFTHALWREKEGKTEQFIEAWKYFGKTLSEVPNSPTVEGTLIQNLSDPLLFQSFGGWESLEQIEAMRRDAKVKKALSQILELCTDAQPGNYKTVLHLSFPAG